MIEQTKQMLSELYCHGMLESVDLRLAEATTHGWSHSELLAALFTDEKLYRDGRQTERRIRAAEFRVDAIAERWDYNHKRSITKPQVQELLELGFLKNSRNLILIGQTGVGKSYLAQCLGDKACRHKFSVKFIGMNLFIEKASLARSDGSYLKFRDKMIKADLLILDDIGISRLPQQTTQDLYDILEERFHSKSTLITTQVPLENWKDFIEDAVALEAILDRLSKGAITLNIMGPTYRDKAKKSVQNIPLDNS